MYFQQHILHKALFGGFIVDSLQQSFGVHRLNKVRPQFEQIPHFIGLEVSYEMPADIGGQGRHFLLQFLHAALAEVSLSGFIRFTNRLYGVKLTHAHERHARGYVSTHAPYLFFNHCA